MTSRNLTHRMWILRRSLLSVIAVAALAAGCSSSDTSADTSVTTAGADASSAATVSQRNLDDFELSVTAVGGGGLIDSVEIDALTGLETVDGGVTASFDLVLQYCCGEPNEVVFEDAADDWSRRFEDRGPVLSGPSCGRLVDCSTPGERRVALRAHDANPVEFELSWESSDALAVEALTTELTPTFVFEAATLGTVEMSIILTVRLDPALGAPSGITTPVSTPHREVTVIGGGLDVLPFPIAGIADAPSDLALLLAPAAGVIDVADLGVDWPAQAVVVLAIPSDLCPPVLAGFEHVEDSLQPVWHDPGYVFCEEPLLSYTVIAAVDRTLLSTAASLVLPDTQPYFDTEVVVPIDISPGSGRTIASDLAPAELTEVQGTAPLPDSGEAVVAVLADGRPVLVVRHHDNTVSAIDLRSETGLDGDMTVVRWTTSRYLIGNGAWDEYGRRVDGDRSTDLRTYATRVTDGVVEVGQLVSPPIGSPLTSRTDRPAMANVALSPGNEVELLSLEDALLLPPGVTVFVDASVVVGPEGAYVCKQLRLVVEPCPDDSPEAESYEPTPDWRTVRKGPLLATRTTTGFTEIAPIGGYGGSTL